MIEKKNSSNEEKKTIKESVDRATYIKEYAKKQATIKVSKEYYQIAKNNAKHHHRNMKSYIEYLIFKDSKDIANES